MNDIIRKMVCIMRPAMVAGAMAVLLLACAQEQDKQARLVALKKNKTAIEKEIATLEKELGGTPVNTREVRVREIKAAPFEYVLQTQGRVESDASSVVSSMVSGMLKKVFVKEGDEVKKGQVLAQIDDAVLVKTLEELNTNLSLAKVVFERRKNLWEQNIGTEIQYLEAKTTKEGLEKRMAVIKEQLDMFKIIAPVSGVVEVSDFRVGEMLSPMFPAFAIVNNGALKVNMLLSEAYLSKVKKGNRVVIRFPEIDRELNSAISFVGRSIDMSSRSFLAEAAIEPDHNLGPNMTAIVKIIYHREPEALCVPMNVIQEVNGEQVLYVASHEKDHWVARKRVVLVAAVFGETAHVVEGLSAGDHVIIIGFQGLHEGDLINI